MFAERNSQLLSKVISMLYYLNGKTRDHEAFSEVSEKHTVATHSLKNKTTDGISAYIFTHVLFLSVSNQVFLPSLRAGFLIDHT